MRALVVFVFILTGSRFALANDRPPFAFHLLNEPTEIDPQKSNGGNGSFLLTNLFRGLYRYHARDGLILEMAEKCSRKERSLVCKIKKNALWSDGQPVKAEDFVRAMRFLIDPKNKTSQAALLFSLKNARAIYRGEIPPDRLGVSAPHSSEVRFEFADSDFEFEWKLADPALSPRRSENFYSWKEAPRLITNGPYKVEAWTQGASIRLFTNKYYDSHLRPPVLVYFIDSDTTALRMYEAGKLSLLRRLVTTEIARFKGRPDFFQIPMARFDYIGFGPDLLGAPHLREALIESLDYGNFQKLFDALGTPGCPSLPLRLSPGRSCEKMNLPRARAVYEKREIKSPKLHFAISQMGGDDIQRAAEWFQGQWAKNLGLRISITSFEQGTFLQKLKLSPPTLFRKGVGLDRPTCQAALEIFTTKSPENYIRFSDPDYDAIVERLAEDLSTEERARLCRQALERLRAAKRIIPLGEIHFSILASPDFKSWTINELNQLDLTELTSAHPPRSRSIERN